MDTGSSIVKKICLSLLIIQSVFSLTVYANEKTAQKHEKIKYLGDYQVKLICDKELDGREPQNCRISITDPNEPDKSKATVVLQNTEILIDSEKTAPGNSLLFSDDSLDDAQNKKDSSLINELQKYKIERNWLFRLEMSDEQKEPDVSLLSIIVPNENYKK